MKVISIDPGGVTGFASFTIPMTNDTTPLWSDNIKDNFSNYGQFQNAQHHDELDAFLRKNKPNFVVCERFEKRNNDFSLLISCEYIGVVKRYCQNTKTPLCMQGASEALTWCDRGDKMDALNLTIRPYTANKDANAARKHLLYYLVFNHKTMLIRKRLLEELKED
jgi:hypothetical protein